METGKVWIHICGQHSDLSACEAGTEADTLESAVKADSYFRNGKQYFVYNEAAEDGSGVIRNTIKLSGEKCVEIRKTGLVDTKMVFEKGKSFSSGYRTPYLQMNLEVFTEELELLVTEKKIDIQIHYRLNLNGTPLSACKMALSIREG